MRRAIFYAIAGAVAAVLNATAIAGPILETVAHGGPAWLLWFLFTPLGLFGFGLAAGARSEHLHYNARRAPIVPQWRVWADEPRRNGDPIDRHMAEVLAALGKPWPLNLAGKPAVIPPKRGGE